MRHGHSHIYCLFPSLPECIKYFLTLTFLLCHLWCAGQEHYFPGKPELDRLHTLPAPPDTSRIRQMINAGWNLLEKDTDSSLSLFRTALAQSRQSRFINGLIESFTGIGGGYGWQSNYKQSLAVLQEALPYTRHSTDHFVLAKYYTVLGAAYIHNSIFDSAIHYIYKSTEEIELYAASAPHPSANVNRIYNNMGVLWSNLKITERSREYYLKAAEMALACGDTSGASNALLNLSSTYLNTDDWQKGVPYVRDVIAWNHTKRNREWLRGRIFEAQFLAKEGKTEEAIRILNYLLPYVRKETNRLVISDAYWALGSVQYQGGAYALAENALQEALKVSYDDETVSYIYELLSEIYRKNGNYRSAFVYLKKGTELQRTLLNKEKIQALYEQETNRRVSEKNKDITRQQLLIATQREEIAKKNFLNFLILSATIILLLSAIMIYRHFRHKQNVQQNQLRIIQQEQEINNLRFMIQGEEKERTRMARELHDGIMVQLSTIKMNLKTLPAPLQSLPASSYVRSDHYEQIIHQLENTTKELRQTAHNLMPDMLLAEGLPDAVFYFCEAITKNLPLKIIFHQDGPLPRIKAELELSIYRIIQELVQNIIKHARASQAIVQLFYTENQILAITVEDDGQGFNLTENKHISGGMGLQSIRSRMQVLKGIMEIQTAPGKGTTVYLEFDLRDLNNIDNQFYEPIS